MSPRRPRCYLYRAQGTFLPATLAPSYTPLYSWASPYVYKRGCPGPHEKKEEKRRRRGEKGGGQRDEHTNIRAFVHMATVQGPPRVRNTDSHSREKFGGVRL
jgi:hypothetical protein